MGLTKSADRERKALARKQYTAKERMIEREKARERMKRLRVCREVPEKTTSPTPYRKKQASHLTKKMVKEILEDVLKEALIRCFPVTKRSTAVTAPYFAKYLVSKPATYQLSPPVLMGLQNFAQYRIKH